MNRVVTEYALTDSRGALRSPLRAAVVADLHNGDVADVLPRLREADVILVPGDLLDRHRRGFGQVKAFLRLAPEAAPTFFSLGNHDWKSQDSAAFLEELALSGVTVLDNRIHRLRADLVLGGLSSRPAGEVDSAVVGALAREEGFRLLLCHHPEYYGRYVQGQGIDLTVSGHAHGGQWVIRGRGLYAPGQGLLPRYTCGFYDGEHLLVSRGMTNNTHLPRFCNPCELLMLTLLPGGAPGKI